MRIDDMVIVSVDDHIIEPPDVFKNSLPAQYRDTAPRMVNQNGADFWVFDDARQPNFALNATVGRPRHELGLEPFSFAQIRRGCYDVHARIQDMNAAGLAASMNFPTMPGFAGEMFLSFGDKATNYIILQAYNDWHIDEWCGAYPGRFIPLPILPLWDINLMVQEVHRVARKGCRAVNFPGITGKIGLPAILDDFWTPLWKALDEEAMRVCIHIGQGGGSEPLSPESTIDSIYHKAFLSSISVTVEYLWSNIPRTYKNIKFVLSEGGIGWIPTTLERADFIYERHSPWTRQDFGDKKPSDIFREHFISCFITDRHGLASRKEIGIDTITYECDYPHADCLWPEVPEKLMAEFVEAGCTDEEIDKITHKNAIRTLGLDPIAVLGGRDKCNVGALRAKAQGVKLTTDVVGGHSAARADGKPITAADFAKLYPPPTRLKKTG